MHATKPKAVALSPVKGSSQIDAIGHSGDTLAVKFKSGGAVYHYHGVTAADFEKFKSAESLGKHLGQHIKGKFKFSKLDS